MKYYKRNVPAVFVNTGNEYPEIRKFAQSFENVTTIQPKMNLKKVIEKYGFPLISKEYSKMIYELRNGSPHSQRYLTGIQQDGKKTMFVLPQKWRYLINEKFSCSDKCCNYLKKSITANMNCITAKMAVESKLRAKSWLRTGCNSFSESKRGHSKSKPFSIWTEKDIWEYKERYNMEFCSIYNDMRITRTGCMFCGFGANYESLSRFEYLMENYPKIYDYFLKLENNGITYKQALNTTGVLLPNQNGFQKNIFSKL